jgi:hypothetical protein
MADDINTEAQRQTATYARTIAWLRHTQPDLSDEAMDAQALEAVEIAVYGADAKKDAKGNRVQQGIGSRGRESHNHLQAILKYEGREAHAREVARIWKETPDHARALGLAQPRA